jgi:serine/threonine protein kinase
MLQTEQVLGVRYQLRRQLANNAGRQTWLATDIKASPAKPVIVKLLAFSPQMQWEEFKLFEREAQVLKTLNHPRIPKYQDYFSLDRDMGKGLCWFALVQDYIPGKSLQQLLDEGMRFTETQVRSLATQVLEILTYLHGLNPPVLHRDIKPSNLIWGEDEQVYLVDFGAVQDPTAVEGATFTVVGTAGYAPLEQFYGKAVPASDLYALGATLIHLLTGTAPADLPQSNLRIQFRDQVSLNPGFLRWIESLVQPDLDRRFSSATQAFEALLTGSSLQLSHKPAGSCVRLKKSLQKLVIKIPRRQISLWNCVKFIAKLMLVVGVRLFLLFPSLIGIVISLWVIYGVGTEELIKEAMIIPIILMGLIIFSWKKNKQNLASFLAELNELIEQYFGLNYVRFFKPNFAIEPPLLLSFGDKRYRMQRISDIETLDVVPLEGIVIETGKHRYVLGKHLTEPEREWLVQEIQDWLSQG